jgi:glycosyltransferase involved in cell wall biosynthesis
VIDDGSTDGFFDLLQFYASRDNRIMLIQNRYSIGLANSLDKAIQTAKGKYIMCMGQDDLNISDRLEQQITEMSIHPEVGCVSCFVDALFQFDTPQETRTGVALFEQQRRQLAVQPQRIPEILPLHNVFHHGEVIFRKQLWEQVGGYRAAFVMSENYDLWLRMIGHTSFAIISHTLYIRRFGKKNSSAVYSSLQEFTAQLARECYQLRCRGSDDIDV